MLVLVLSSLLPTVVFAIYGRFSVVRFVSPTIFRRQRPQDNNSRQGYDFLSFFSHPISGVAEKTPPSDDAIMVETPRPTAAELKGTNRQPPPPLRSIPYN
ncbi:unnamed protein product [Ectocarpus sp. 12 AP-2014]